MGFRPNFPHGKLKSGKDGQVL